MTDYAKKIPSTSGRSYEVVDIEELKELFELDSEDYEDFNEWLYYQGDEVLALPQGWEESKSIFYYFDESMTDDKSDTLITVESLKDYFTSEEQKELFNDYQGDFNSWVVDLDRWDIAYRIGLIRC